MSKAFLENEISVEAQSNLEATGESRASKMGLPVPLAKDGKVIPPTIYTSKNFDTRRSAYSSQWLQKEDRSSGSSDTPTPQNLKMSELNESSLEFVHEQHDEEHLPAGQHLLVDIDGIDEGFLDSEQQLATAMIELVDSSGLTLLSYHCHGLTPAGVSCAGVLLESHVSFHTWPAEGVITLDLFTCGSASLLNSLHLIEDLFVIPRKDSNSEEPRMLWAYKRRGFKEQSSLTGERDTFAYPLGIHGLEVKKEVRKKFKLFPWHVVKFVLTCVYTPDCINSNKWR
jgi:S-adenosylmethionine decarboxylase proenzyme